MGVASSMCCSRGKSMLDSTQDRVMGVVCCRKSIKGRGRGIRYGGSQAGGKYDESDDEDSKGMLYNNNLLLDDDDDEEE